MHDLQIVNINLSLKIDSISFEDVIEQTLHLQNNRKLNFIVIFQTYTYTIFKPNGLTGLLHCNVTKVKSMSDISLAVEEFFTFFPTAELKCIAIDNITATTIFDTKKNLDLLFTDLSPKYSIKYNIQKFPAIFIRYPVEHIYVTVFIFSSGKVICVGGKCLKRLNIVSHWLQTDINNI